MRNRHLVLVQDTRSHSSHVYDAVLSDDHSHVPYTLGTYSFPVEFSDEVMVDVSPGSRVRPNPCVHKMAKVKYFHPGLSDYMEAAPPGHIGQVTYTNMSFAWWIVSKGIHNHYGWDLATMDTPPGLSLNIPPLNDHVIFEDCVQQAIGQIADHMLNLAEAHEIPAAVTSFRRYLPDLLKNWKSWQLAVQKARRLSYIRIGTGRALRRQVVSGSNLFLAWKFGFAPLYSDMVKTYKFLVDTKKKLSKYKTDEVVSSSRTHEFSPTYVDGGANNYYDGVRFTYEFPTQWIASHPGKLVHTAYVRPNFKRWHPVLQDVQNMINRFGSGPAEFAWERIPFSFIVDWFVDLRSVLRQLDKLIGYKPFEVVGFTLSTKWEGDISSRAIYRRNSDSSVIVDYLAYATHVKAYERSVVRPGIKPELNVRFGKSNLGICIALITQLLLGVKVRRR